MVIMRTIGLLICISCAVVCATALKVKTVQNPDYIADTIPAPTHKDGEKIRTAVFVEQSSDGEERNISFSSHNRDHNLKLKRSKAVDLSKLPIRLLGASEEEENKLKEAVKDVEFMSDTKHLASLAFKRNTNEFLNGGFKLGQHDFKLNSNPDNSSEIHVVRQKKPKLDKIDDYVRGIKGRYDKSNSREKRSITTNRITANVEVVFICDYGIWSEFNSGGYNSSHSANDPHLSLVYYVAHMANMMNAHYATMLNNDIEISVELTGLIILTNDQVLTNLTEDIADTIDGMKYVDLERTLDGFSEWLTSQEAADVLPPHDHTMLLTGYDIYDAQSSATGTIGVAWTGKICSANESNSITEMRAGLLTTDASTAAHELGHNLGASHDSQGCGSESASDIDFNYVMTAYSGTVDNLDNRFLFSCCSQRAFYGTMTSKTCFLAENSTYSNTTILDHISNYLPGEVFSKDDQCYITYGTPACGDWIYSQTGADFCKDLWCVSPDDPASCINEYTAPADGTACGQNSWCIHGQCVATSTTPASLLQNQQCNVTSCYEEREFTCVDGLNKHRPGMFRCVDNDWQCDGEEDCTDGSDEQNCPYSECGGNLDGSGVFTSPNYPSDYSDNLFCEWIISVPEGRAEISFNTFDLEHDSRCAYDSIVIRDGSSIGAILATLCGNSISLPDTYSASGSTLYVALNTDGSTRRSGFSATYSATFATIPSTSTTTPSPDTCGGTRQAPNGVITSQYYPNNYPSNEYCEWYISVPAGILVITITNYDIEESSTCQWDYLQIIDSSSGNQLSMLCGTSNAELVLTATSSSVKILFKTDSSSTRAGFYLTWTANTTAPTITPSPYTCGGTRQAPNGVITSQYYPNNYPSNEHCEWYISVPAGIVEITITNYDIEYTSTCRYDYLQIIDLNSGNELSMLCGSSDAELVQTASSSSVKIVFKTDSSSTRAGFYLTWTSRSCESIGGKCMSDSNACADASGKDIDSLVSCGSNQICCYSQQACDPSTHFQCTLGFDIISSTYSPCVPLTSVCDGQEHCSDGSDESSICPRDCLWNEFECTAGRNLYSSANKCVDFARVCDHYNDCTDYSDESSLACQLPSPTTPSGIPVEPWRGGCDIKCPESYHILRYKSQCIPNEALCNGEQDCFGGWDETSCDIADCSDSNYMCTNGRLIGNNTLLSKCVDAQSWCNGKVDCNDNSDENNCTNNQCGIFEFKCLDGFDRSSALREVCIRAQRVCDGNVDCTDASDEGNCTSNNDVCSNEGKNRCTNGFNIHSLERSTCYTNEWVCDGEPDCSDRSDEFDCTDDQGERCYLCRDTSHCIRQSTDCNYLCPSDPYCETGVREIGAASVLSHSRMLLIVALFLLVTNCIF